MINRIKSRTRQAKYGTALVSKETLTKREKQYITALSNRLDKEQAAHEQHFHSQLNPKPLANH